MLLRATKKLFQATCSNGDQDSNWEVWRLRLNWLYLIISGSLYPISYVAAFTSFHQFVTNPRSESLNATIHNIEPGLGQSENFYSWTLALFNIGSFSGAIGTGCLIKLVPYWYLNLVALLAHTSGYILLLITYDPWVVMISKALSGFYIGAESTVVLAYLAESSVDYTRAMKKLGRKVGKSSDIRNHLYALHHFGVIAGFFIGPCAAIVFAQFDINQFRAIVWFNVAVGVAFIVLQLFMFHGEVGWNYKMRKQCTFTEAARFWTSPLEICVVLFLLVCRGVISFRFGVYETIYNPVLSDYFGLTEQSNTYFFFGLVLARFLGTAVVLLLQFKLNSRIITVISFTVTFASLALIADWQAIPNDPCTEYSPFHHPEILTKYQMKLDENKTTVLCHDLEGTMHNYSGPSCIQDADFKFPPKFLELLRETNIHINIDDFMIGNYSLPNGTCTHLVSHHDCRKVNSCETDFLRNRYKLNSNYCLELQPEKVDAEIASPGSNYSAFLCKSPITDFTMCFDVPFAADVIRKYTHTGNESQSAKAQVIQVLNKDVNELAMQECEQAYSESGWNCRWLPNSVVTNELCEDCQPICRSAVRSLNFAQFCLGASLLMASIPLGSIPISALTSDRVRKEMQGLISGASNAFSSIGRAVSPLWLDAAYEGVQKRTFLAMVIMAGAHLPFLVGIIVMYRKLGEKNVDQSLYVELATEDSFDEVEREHENKDSGSEPEKSVWSIEKSNGMINQLK